MHSRSIIKNLINQIPEDDGLTLQNIRRDLAVVQRFAAQRDGAIQCRDQLRAQFFNARIIAGVQSI